MPAVQELRRLGCDVLTTVEAGKADQAISDEQVLEFAREQQRILVTLNRKHFIRLHGQYRDHAGIIVCTFDPDFAGLAQRIRAAIDSSEGMEGTEGIEGNAQLAGQLIRVNRPNNPVS
jgi:hypothetical protein